MAKIANKMQTILKCIIFLEIIDNSIISIARKMMLIKSRISKMALKKIDITYFSLSIQFEKMEKDQCIKDKLGQTNEFHHADLHKEGGIFIDDE